MAQKVQNVYVGQGSGPLPSATRAPTLPPSPKIFWGFFVFHVRVFFSFRASWRAHILQWRHHFSTLSWPHQRPFQRCIALWGCRNGFGVINPQIDPLWVIFADFDILAPPGELVCVCRASVLLPDDRSGQGRQFLFPVNFSLGVPFSGQSRKTVIFGPFFAKMNKVPSPG